MKKIFVYAGLLSLCFSTTVSAMSLQTEELTDPQKQLNRYKTTSTVMVGDIMIPQVVLLELTENSYGSLVLVDENNKQVPIRMYTGTFPKKELQVRYSNFSSTLEQLQKDTGGYYFDSRENIHDFEIEVIGSSVNYMSLNFIANTLPPKSISVEYKQNDQWVPVVTKISRTNNIPLGSVSGGEDNKVQLRVTIESDHLVGMIAADVFSDKKNNGPPAIYWYAEPNSEFTLYQNPSFGQKNNFQVPSRQPLAFDGLTPRVLMTDIQGNPFYNPDFDADGIDDVQDLCPQNKDATNADIDNNGRGDVCEDKDLDGRVAGVDNCPIDYNPKQSDEDADGVGDECDDVDNRTTELLLYLEIVLFGLIAGVLLWLVYRSRRQ